MSHFGDIRMQKRKKNHNAQEKAESIWKGGNDKMSKIGHLREDIRQILRWLRQLRAINSTRYEENEGVLFCPISHP